VQVFSPAPTPEGPAPYQRAQPPRSQECTCPADAAATDSWSNSGCVWSTLRGCFSPPYLLPIFAWASVAVDWF